MGKEEELVAETETEKQLLKHHRNMQGMEPGSKGYRLANELHPIRVKKDRSLAELNRTMISIEETTNEIRSYKAELKAGITSEVKPGIKYTEKELNIQILLLESQREDFILAARQYLFGIRTYIDTKDYAQNTMFMMKDFDNKVDDVEARLNECGIKLFENS